MKNPILAFLMAGILSFPAWGSGNHPFHKTSAQKGVNTSCDVILVAMPVATVAGVLIEQDWTGLKEGAFTAAATLGATLILKTAVHEDRPDHSNRHSFPSGHTSIMMADATFLMRRYGWKLGVPAYALSAYVGWGRVYGKKHHWWDVAAGAAIGAGASMIFTHPYARKHEISLAPVPLPDGVGLSFSMNL